MHQISWRAQSAQLSINSEEALRSIPHLERGHWIVAPGLKHCLATRHSHKLPVSDLKMRSMEVLPHTNLETTPKLTCLHQGGWQYSAGLWQK